MRQGSTERGRTRSVCWAQGSSSTTATLGPALEHTWGCGHTDRGAFLVTLLGVMSVGLPKPVETAVFHRAWQFSRGTACQHRGPHNCTGQHSTRNMEMTNCSLIFSLFFIINIMTVSLQSFQAGYHTVLDVMPHMLSMHLHVLQTATPSAAAPPHLCISSMPYC